MYERTDHAWPHLARLLGLVLLAVPAAGQDLPDGFVAEPIGAGWVNPTGLAFIDEERLLVAERDGRVWLVENDVRRNLILDLASETLTNGDRGLLGIAPDPDFYVTGWLYLLLVVDPQNGGDQAALAFARLIRVQTSFDGAGDLHVVPGTRTELLGSDWSTGIPSCHLSHTIGSLRFLSDGSLVLTTGDNAHYDFTDPGGADPGCFEPGRTPPDQDVGAYRSQYDDTLCGKVLRLDPATGGGLPDNPYYTGDPFDLRSRIWARGLRNPFRFTLLPDTGPREALLIADVGWSTWEEINLCLGGENFGWPCYEGLNPQSDYQAADPSGFCNGLEAEHTPPLVAWHHSQSGATGFRGNSATGLAVYTGESYPPVFRGRLFFFDYGRNWLRAARLDENLQIQDTLSFGREMAGPVDLVSEPGTGDLVYATLGSQGVFRLRYLGASMPPIAVASAEPAFGPGDLLVTLTAEGSNDPEGQALTYSWDLGDGNAADGSVVQHDYTGVGSYLARVTVTDTEGLSDTAEVLITPNNTPPRIVSWSSPVDGQAFHDGEPIRLVAEAEDDEDGDSVDVEWTLDLIHDHHVHPNWATATGAAATVEPEAHGPGDIHYVVRLTATDRRGLVDEESRPIYDEEAEPLPHLVQLDSTNVRVGQTLSPVGHVDFSYGQALGAQPTLTWDWGDGEVDVFPELAHEEDTRPAHAYRRAGTYKLRMIAEHEGLRNEHAVTIRVVGPRPAVAIFAPLDEERWVARDAQTAIVAGLEGALARRTAEVRPFGLGQGELLAGWMESLLDDSIADVLVLIDFVPAALVEGGVTGSLLERWLENGNGVVWTGFTPFLVALGDDGSLSQILLGADELFDATEPYINQGRGNQTPTALGEAVLPDLPEYHARRALRYDQLGPLWHVTRIFGEDGDADADAIEIEHASRGFYAQFFCDDEADLPRAEVLADYLRDKVGRGRLR